MARAIWTGSLSFGLVNVPVAAVTAVRDLDLHFRQLHRKDGAPIDVQRVCSKEKVEVPWEEVTHGYELDGQQVTVSDLELEAIEPRKTRTIDIERFVELPDIDPIYFDHPYFLVPASEDDGALRAYRLLTEVMSRTERAAVGRFVMRARERIAIVRPAGDRALRLTTGRFADEIRSRSGVDAASRKAHKPTPKQLEAAVAVIEELTCDWEPDKYTDRYRERLKKVVARKRKGQTVKPPEPREDKDEAPDLMAALERTLEELKAR
jgi:DNA end-binding protein Ku